MYKCTLQVKNVGTGSETKKFYRTESNLQNPITIRDNKQPTSDMADVLLSLKHAVVHPGQTSSEKYDNQQHLYHPQVLLSPGGYSGSICEQQFGHQQTPMFPSMSVNVSMNMTMHGYHPTANYPAAEIQCPQVKL